MHLEFAKADLYGKPACLAKGLGQDSFDTLVALAGKANKILDNDILEEQTQFAEEIQHELERTSQNYLKWIWEEYEHGLV